MRIGIARIWQETSTFSPQLTDLELLRVYGIGRGAAALEGAGLMEEYVAGFLDVAAGHEVVGVTRVQAMPAGRLTASAQETVISWFEEDLKRALPLDGLLLSLHGAFAGEAEHDLEGLVAERARAILGPRVPLAAAMDLHGNITRRKVANLDIIDALHTHPHVDSRQTGQRAARLLLRTLEGQVRPHISAVKIPMLTPAESQITALPPMSLLFDETRRQEERDGALLSSLFAVQPWLDVPELGWASVVVTDDDPELGDRLARRLAAMAWEQREHYAHPCPTYREALDQAFASPLRPVVISDLADLMTGGGTGDSTWYLRELVARRPSEPCYLTMVDRQAAAELAAAGEGAQTTVFLGGKLDNVYSQPVEVTGRVLRVIPPAAGRALPETMGLTVTLQVGNVCVVVFEHLGPGADPLIYSGAGLDPRQAKVLIAKSVVDFRQGYRDVARLFLLGEAPGLAPSNLLSLRWEHAPRPLFPLDRSTSFAGERAEVYHSRASRR